MFQPSPRTTVVIPYREGPESELGPVVNDAYFGKVPADRLRAAQRPASSSRATASTAARSASRRGARPGSLGSYDAASGLLTIVSYTRPEGASDYVNSMWEIQKQPYRGDVVNSYNDGPPAPGAKPLGPFYELETSSPAAALAAGRPPHPRAPDVPRPGRARASRRAVTAGCSASRSTRSSRRFRVPRPASRYFSFFSSPQSWLPEPWDLRHASRQRWMSTSSMRGLGFLASREGNGGNGLCGSDWYQ